MNKLNPNEAYRAALQADDYIPCHIPKKWQNLISYKDTILKLRSKKWPYVKIEKFLKEECGIKKGSSFASVQQYVKSLKNESGEDNNNTGTTGNRENYAIAHAVGTGFQTVSAS